MKNKRQILDALEGAYKTTKVDRFIQIRSRCLFPDGHPAFVYVPEHDPRLVMDLGETMTWIRARSTQVDRSDREERQYIDKICVSRDLQYAHGMFLVRVSEISEINRAVDRLSRATVWLAEMWLKDRHMGEDGSLPER